MVTGVSAADFYTGIVADVYAALRSTTFDAGRYLEFVRDAGQPALELGCGEDGPFLELLRRGIDIDGVDSSQDMLDRCQAQADIEGLRIATYCQPMQDLKLPRSYRAIYLAGPTFNLLPDDDTARRTLQGIADHLEPGGQAMVPLWIPPATDQQEFGRTREASVAGGMTARYTRPYAGTGSFTGTPRAASLNSPRTPASPSRTSPPSRTGSSPSTSNGLERSQ